MDIPTGSDNSVRIGYAWVSTRTQEHQAQLDALAAAEDQQHAQLRAVTADNGHYVK